MLTELDTQKVLKTRHFQFDRPAAQLSDNERERRAFQQLTPNRQRDVAHYCAKREAARDKSDPFAYSRVMSHFQHGVVTAEDFGLTNPDILFTSKKKAA